MLKRDHSAPKQPGILTSLVGLKSTIPHAEDLNVASVDLNPWTLAYAGIVDLRTGRGTVSPNEGVQPGPLIHEIHRLHQVLASWTRRRQNPSTIPDGFVV